MKVDFFCCAVKILLLKTFCRKMAENSLNMLIKCVKMDKKVEKINMIMNFPACTYKSENVAQSQRNFALMHGSETVAFRNSDLNLPTFLPVILMRLMTVVTVGTVLSKILFSPLYFFHLKNVQKKISLR